MSRAIVLSGQGRQHLAEQLPGLWLGACGSRITRPRSVLPVDYALLDAGPVPVCAYCYAIGAAIRHERVLAAEAVADALADGMHGRRAAA